MSQHSGRSDRELAVEGLHNIETHEKVCDQRNEKLQLQFKSLSDGQAQIQESVDELKTHLKSLYNRWWTAAVGGIAVLSGLCIWLVQQVLSK